MTDDPIKLREASLQALRRKSPESFMAFVDSIVIASAYGPRLLCDCIAPFQREAFECIAPSLEALQRREKADVRRFWWERTKGTSKDADAAIILLWLVAFTEWPLYGQVGAADREQAGIVKRRAEVLLFENPWLEPLVEIIGREIKGKQNNTSIDILAADVSGGAHGETPDFLLLNELSHVQRWKFIEDLMDNAQKVPMGIVLAATNAGFTGTDAERWKKIAEKSSMTGGNWFYQCVNYPAPWITAEDLADASLRDKGTRYRRLWWGEWTDGKGDALNREMITRSITLAGPETGPSDNLTYLGGLDLGVSNDHAGVVLLGYDEQSQTVNLAAAYDFPPLAVGNKRQVDLQSVRECVRGLHQTFDTAWFGYDPHQAALMAQELISESQVPMVSVSFTGKNLDQMATLLVDAFQSGKINIYEDDHLLLDLKKLTLVEKPYGFKLEATRDATGHADVATALVIALLGAFGHQRLITEVNDSLTCSSRETMRDFVDEELLKLPDELRELVEDSRIGYDASDDEWKFN